MPLIVNTANAQEVSAMSQTQKQELLNKNLDGVLRGFVWDLPPTLILESEKGTFAGEEDMGDAASRLFYVDNIDIGDIDTEIKSVRASIGYEFLNDQLWRARVFIEKKYLDTQERIEDLMRVRKNLVNIYGEPVDEQMVWHGNREKNWPDSWGWAILRGELMMTIIFRNAETEVVVFLGARQRLNPNLDDPEFNITYTSLEKIETFQNLKKQDLLKLP